MLWKAEKSRSVFLFAWHASFRHTCQKVPCRHRRPPTALIVSVELWIDFNNVETSHVPRHPGKASTGDYRVTGYAGRIRSTDAGHVCRSHYVGVEAHVDLTSRG